MTCDRCAVSLPASAPALGCRACNYDLSEPCGGGNAACSEQLAGAAGLGGLRGVIAALEADAFATPGAWLGATRRALAAGLDEGDEARYAAAALLSVFEGSRLHAWLPVKRRKHPAVLPQPPLPQLQQRPQWLRAPPR